MEVYGPEDKWLPVAVTWSHGLRTVLGESVCGPEPASLYFGHVLGIHLNIYQVWYRVVALCVFGCAVAVRIHMTYVSPATESKRVHAIEVGG